MKFLKIIKLLITESGQVLTNAKYTNKIAKIVKPINLELFPLGIITLILINPEIQKSLLMGML